jgi:hypothetical protein
MAGKRTMASTLTNVSPALLTVEDVAAMPDPGYPFELVRGRIVRLPPPLFRHGQVCGNIVVLVGQHVRQADCGRLVCNDSGVVTQRDPDSLRGVDVGYFSYQRLPRETVPDRYTEVAPEAAF